MAYLRVRGGKPLRGTLRVQGAKNAALPILAATLCTGARCTLRNCPEIRDVHTAITILRSLGCEASFSGGVATVDATKADGTRIDAPLAGKMRSSVTFLGALLAARGEAQVALPGGCVLGERPLDLHLSGLAQLGCTVEQAGECIRCRGPVRGGTAILRYPSVGATENLLLAACAAGSPVTILGAAREPEIVDLAGFLNACGARIDGAGTGMLRVLQGPCRGCEYRIMPDRMDAATWLCAGAAAGGTLTLAGISGETLAPVCDALSAAGCEIRRGKDEIHLRAGPLRAIAPVTTGPYPAFPTDAQAPLMAALLRAEGITVFDETVFEDRYRHVPALRRLGAQILVRGSIARVRGVAALHGADMEATDLRGGAAMLIAALSADGESRIAAPEHLARGYERLCERLRGLGADAAKIETTRNQR